MMMVGVFFYVAINYAMFSFWGIVVTEGSLGERIGGTGANLIGDLGTQVV